MNSIDSVRNMQEYIENHLNDKITLADLSKVAFYSPWHCYRLFSSILGITPSDYIRKLKLSKSALELRDYKTKILDVALKYGYDSTDGYQRAFFKEFGTNPNKYAQNPIPICLFTPYKQYEKKEKLKVEKEIKNVFISIVTKPERKVILKRGKKATEYWTYCNEVGCEIWELLSSMKSLSGEPVCLWLPKKYIPEGTSEYVQGVEVETNYDGVIPEGFDVITLPQAEYLMFQGEPFNDEDYEEAIGDLWKAMDNYNPAAVGYKWDTSNPRIQLEPRGIRGYIELKPVCKK